MDPPAAKKRRLAPKEPPQPPPAFAHEVVPQVQHYQVQEVPPAPPPPERHEFESFARHLQDAAMLIYRQSQTLPYSNVSALLLRWEGEDSVAEHELDTLQQVLHDRYNYRTERWDIPITANVSVKLGVRMSAFLERQAPDHLLIIYYAGYAFVGERSQLFWASDATETAAKINWNGLRCLFEESPSDMLLMLDTCGVREAPISSSSGSVKQIIAASTPEQSIRESPGRSFTALTTEAFLRLSVGRPFTADILWQEIAYHRQQELRQSSALTNGAHKNISVAEKLPIVYTLSTGKGYSVVLGPLATRQESLPNSDGETRPPARADDVIHPRSVAGLIFDEQRVLVCTTFVGEASPDMSSFNHWLHSTPGIATKIVVEAMFLGPPTMLLISMPMSVWNVVQHDKVCCFLGHITSKNLTHLYDRLVGYCSSTKASVRDMDDGRILLQAREAAATTPVARRHDLSHGEINHKQKPPETPSRAEVLSRKASLSLSQTPVSGAQAFANIKSVITVAKQDDVEDSAEMQEAAEQLKALSHVRPTSAASASAPPLLVEITPEVKLDAKSPQEATESSMEETHQNTPSARPKPRRSLQKVTPKQETRCNMCSHTPFKDSSSLRKHIAAAHTRPFPCAFAFAGCTSTFGSKNEWKRHIASQHLCLTYYRCSSCPQSSVEGKGNEFNRKDLFTQHLRRMHAPFAIKKALAKGDSKLQVDWETHVKEMQTSCLITRRRPPQRSACPKPDCASVFEGPTSWDEWTEHVGRHMEKGEAARIGVDRLLAKWALEEGIIERKEDGEYRLCSGPGSGTEKEANHDHNNSHPGHVLDGNDNDKDARDPGRDSDRESGRESEEKTIVAASTLIEDRMDVDE